MLNLVAGLDTRPYRLKLPTDLPEILVYKGELVKDEFPICKLLHILLDLTDLSYRTTLFTNINSRADPVLVRLSLSKLIPDLVVVIRYLIKRE